MFLFNFSHHRAQDKRPPEKSCLLLKKTLFFTASFFLMFFLPIGFSEANDDSAPGSDKDKWGITLFNGIFTNRTIGKALLNIPGDFEQNYMHALALAREIWKYPPHLTAELEAMYAKHHGRHDHGRQTYDEFTFALLLRYHTFPWDRFIDTSMAVGEGLSMTSKIPELELQRRKGNSQKFLNYLAIELTFTLPRYPNTSLCYRLHHRSGVFGLFGGARGASDFYLLGFRHRF